MNQVEISYEELAEEFIKELSDLGSEDLGSERGVLATSKDGDVTARRMRLLLDDHNLYGWTDSNTRKVEQIKANPMVAVVVGYFQMEGIASVKGHPNEEPEFLEVIRKKLPHRYENLVKDWSENSDRSVIKIELKRVALFKYSDPVAGVERGIYTLDVDERKAYRLEI